MAQKQVNLNGRTYIISSLQFADAREVFFILLRNVGPGLGELIASLSSGSLSLDSIDPKALGRAIQDVCLRLNAADAAAVSEQFGKCTTVIAGGKKIELTVKIQETHFSGAMGEWFQWLVECVKVNYPDFLAFLTRGANSPSVASDSNPSSAESAPKA